MRKLYVIIFLFYCTSACKKENSVNFANTPVNVKTEAIKFLKKEIVSNDYDQLDWSHISSGKIGENNCVVLIKDLNFSHRVLIAVKNSEKWSANYVNYNVDNSGMSGQFTIQDIHKTSSKTINFANGQVVSQTDATLRKQTNDLRKKLLLTDLPPVTVSAIRYSDNSTIFLNSLYWILNEDPAFQNVFIDFGSSSQYYVSGSSEIAYEIEPDDSMDRTKASVTKMNNCFGSVPDNGAIYSATLCADIPINDKPNVLINGLNPGHAFLILTKANGTNTITQCYGFYPENGPKSLTTLPVTSTIKDDSQHEYNASITMPNLTQNNFNVLLANAEISSISTYQLNGYNCTDYALEVFNSIRSGNEINVPTNPTTGGKVLGGLYNTLNTKKNNNAPEAGNISIGKYNAPTGHGECP